MIMFTKEQKVWIIQIHVFRETTGPIRLKLQGRFIHDPKRNPLESQLCNSSLTAEPRKMKSFEKFIHDREEVS